MPTFPTPTRYAYYFGLAGLLLPLAIGVPIQLIFPEDPGGILLPETVGCILCSIGVAIGRRFDAQHRIKHNLDDRRDRLRRARRWFWFFLLLVPLGLASCPLGIAFGGRTALGTMLALQVLVVPWFAIIAAMLMRSDSALLRQSFALEEAAHRMGFTYTEMPAGDSFQWIPGIRLWNIRQWTHGIEHALTGEVQGRRITVVQVTIHQPEHGIFGTSHQTLYSLEDADLPWVTIVPRWVTDSVQPMPGQKVLPMADQKFADRFNVVGEPRATVLFSPEVCELCLSRPHCHVEVLAGRLIICVRGQVDRPDLYPERLEHLLKLAAALHRALGPT